LLFPSTSQIAVIPSVARNLFKLLFPSFPSI
jgi:hypothetical protein